MSKNMIYADIRSTRRARTVGNDVAPGTPVMVDGRAGVTVTGSGDYSRNVVVGPYTVAVEGGGVGLLDDQATVAFSGTWAFPVAGATAATPEGTPVYIDEDGELTLTATDNEAFGVVDFFRGETSATDTAVKIGAV